MAQIFVTTLQEFETSSLESFPNRPIPDKVGSARKTEPLDTLKIVVLDDVYLNKILGADVNSMAQIVQHLP